jgi:hypothetical protein
LGDLGIDEMIILEWILNKKIMREWTVFSCLRIGQVLANTIMNLLIP